MWWRAPRRRQQASKPAEPGLAKVFHKRVPDYPPARELELGDSGHSILADGVEVKDADFEHRLYKALVDGSGHCALHRRSRLLVRRGRRHSPPLLRTSTVDTSASHQRVSKARRQQSTSSPWFAAIGCGRAGAIVVISNCYCCVSFAGAWPPLSPALTHSAAAAAESLDAVAQLAHRGPTKRTNLDRTGLPTYKPADRDSPHGLPAVRHTSRIAGTVAELLRFFVLIESPHRELVT